MALESPKRQQYTDEVAFNFGVYNPLDTSNSLPVLPIISVDSLLENSKQLLAIQTAFNQLGLTIAPSLESIAKAYSTNGETFLGYLTDALSNTYGISLSQVLKDQAKAALRTVLESLIQKANQVIVAKGQTPLPVPDPSKSPVVPTTPQTDVTDYKPYAFGFGALMICVLLYAWVKRM